MRVVSPAVSPPIRVRVRVRVEGEEMLSAMRSIDNRTSENASLGGILIIGIPQPVPFTKKRGVINNCNDGQLWGEI